MKHSPETKSPDAAAPQMWMPRLFRTPAFAWAAVGAVFLAAQTWVIGRWLAGGGPDQKVTGAYGISQTRRTVLTVCELAVIAAVAVCAAWIIRDLRRKRHVTVHAALFLGYGTAHWMDPVLNYSGWGFANNRSVHHVAGWGPFLPGWSGPEASPQPLIYATGLFFPLLILSPRMTVREVAIFAGTPAYGGVRHSAVRLLAGIGFAHVTLLIWLLGVGLSLRHQGIPADTPSFLRL
ncbi:spirocyclase AveC family protein [Streptomyces aureoversilis]|uniref:Spirocyclase AveC family protein n=1 Tax=Streptomyces aureoversilis TaxID=67277 RepID=A0ABV9ZQ09_9ACTN